MKYSAKNKPLVCMGTQNAQYQHEIKINIKGIMWHSTDANNPTLKRYVQPSKVKPPQDTYTREKWLQVLGKNAYNNDWNRSTQKLSVHAWIGKLADGTVTTVQFLPWDFKCSGCGKGSKGSCNDGWIQFEICEASLTDKAYFEKVYKEACEITAYLCQLYNIDPKGTVMYNGVKVPTILCHADSHTLGLGSDHDDVYKWFNKQGKTMTDVRNDVYKLLHTTVYKIRKSWADAASQIGQYTNLEEAKKACKAGYSVFDESGKAVYMVAAPKPAPAPAPAKKSITEIANEVINGKWGNGEARKQALKKAGYDYEQVQAEVNRILKAPKSYKVQITASALNVRSGPGTNYKIVKVLKKNQKYTIVETKSGWGKLSDGSGWIYLKYTKTL